MKTQLKLKTTQKQIMLTKRDHRYGTSVAQIVNKRREKRAKCRQQYILKVPAV